jgi:hypothetical protein
MHASKGLEWPIVVRHSHRWLRHVFADGGYAGEKLAAALAWLNRIRRLAKDFEASVESAVAWLLIASVKLLSRRLARA